MFIERRRVTPAFAKKALLIANILMIVLFSGATFAFWNIQVIHNRYYLERSLRNIIKSIDLDPPRGLIVDRRGRILAENKLNFTLYLIRENIQAEAHSVKVAAFLADLPEERIRAIIDRYRKYPKFYMIPLQSNLDFKRVAFIQSREDQFPEFRIETQPQRAYPNGALTAHLLGYISEITEAELRQNTSGDYKMSDIVGVTGIERQYDTRLKGRRGLRTFIKDSQEKPQKIVSEEPARIGDTLTLTIDLELQKFIEDSLGPELGAAGLVDLRDGGLLALVSKPGFDPTGFARTLDGAAWQRLVGDPQKPLTNKFIQGLYSPGSVFKIVMALAGLQEGEIDRGTTFFCPGATTIYDRVFHCWQAGGHGNVNVVTALERSCNIFFYNLGRRLEIERIARYASLLGLGGTGLVDLPNENDGIIPSPAWKERTSGQKWFPGETISVAIGEGSLNVTPLQVLRMIANVARRGRSIDFHLMQRIESRGQTVLRHTPRERPLPIDPAHFDLVVEGLYRVVNGEGTARLAAVPGLDVCGKTGTSQIISKENPRYQKLVQRKEFTPNSWFVGFAPRDNPRFALVVFVENGGDAGRIAAPIAGKIFAKLFADEGLL